jgi:hypothetical protein
MTRKEDGVGVALLLLEHSAQVYARDKYHISTSDLARCIWKEKIGQTLVDSDGNQTERQPRIRVHSGCG